MVQGLIFVDDRKYVSERSKAKYKALQQRPICPICKKKFGTLQGLASHFNKEHQGHGKFSEWFTKKHPNFCRNCGQPITTRIQDAYKVSFCSLKCKSYAEFRTEIQTESVRRLGKIYGPMKKGTPSPEVIQQRINTINKKGGAYWKGKHLSEETKRILSNKTKERLKDGGPWKDKKYDDFTRYKMSLRMQEANSETTWKGGLIRFQQMVRASLYPLWTRLILERDNFSCVRCGSGGKLTVHHLRRFRDLVKEVLTAYPDKDILIAADRQFLYDACLIYPPLLDLSNGITLCRSCHKKEHKSKKMLLAA